MDKDSSDMRYHIDLDLTKNTVRASKKISIIVNDLIETKESDKGVLEIQGYSFPIGHDKKDTKDK
ncbi:MAG: hypothetical protein ABF703_07290, partial [Oenococcus sp.]